MQNGADGILEPGRECLPRKLSYYYLSTELTGDDDAQTTIKVNTKIGAAQEKGGWGKVTQTQGPRHSRSVSIYICQQGGTQQR
jgi:hypothetical protein